MFVFNSKYNIGLYKIEDNALDKNKENPLLTRLDVRDRNAKFIADQFRIGIHDNGYLVVEAQSDFWDIHIAIQNKVTAQYEYQKFYCELLYLYYIRNTSSACSYFVHCCRFLYI